MCMKYDGRTRSVSSSGTQVNPKLGFCILFFGCLSQTTYLLAIPLWSMTNQFFSLHWRVPNYLMETLALASISMLSSIPLQAHCGNIKPSLSSFNHEYTHKGEEYTLLSSKHYFSFTSLSNAKIILKTLETLKWKALPLKKKILIPDCSITVPGLFQTYIHRGIER